MDQGALAIFFYVLGIQQADGITKGRRRRK